MTTSAQATAISAAETEIRADEHDPLRVLLVGHTYVAPINQAKLRTIQLRGVRLETLVPSNWRATAGLFVGKKQTIDQNTGLNLTALPVWRPGHAASHLYPLGPTQKLIRRFRPDVIHIEAEAYSFAAAQFSIAGRFLGIRTSLFVWENVDRPLHPTQRVCRSLALSSANGIVCGSKGADRLVRTWGYRGRTVVIPQLGIDLDIFRPGRSPGADEPMTVGFVGRLVPEKGCDILLEAIARLVQRNIPLQCLICGTGPERQRLESICRNLGIVSAVTFVGEVPHEGVPEILRRLSVLVLPSRTTQTWAEQFGHILIEAMATGCVVVGSNSGAIPEVVGLSGLIFEENYTEGLTEILARLAGDANERATLSAFFRDRAVSEFAHDRIAGRFIAFWQTSVLETDSIQ